MATHLNALGIVTALGRGRQSVRRALLAGDVSGIQRLDGAGADGESLPFAGVTAPLVPMPKSLDRFASRNVALSLTAIDEIRPDIAAALARYGADRVAVVAASSTSGIERGEVALQHHMAHGAIPDQFDFLQQEIGSVGEALARYLECRGPALTISTACSSGAKAFASARRLLDLDLADAVIVGAADSFCRLTVTGFYALSALTASSCLPFSRNRNGTMLGEGAAFFLATREPKAVLLAAVGESSDAYHPTAPHPEGEGALAAMRAALAEATLTPADIRYINLHGTATVQNDAMESKAVKALFGESVPCSSSKAQIGHTLGAAGAIETGFCWLALTASDGDMRLPPHIWDGVADPDLLSACLAGSDDRLPAIGPAWCMSNSYAFGGSNASVIVGRVT
jgi:3-oxoacyl-[acyl-carrier-protein] synthase-1